MRSPSENAAVAKIEVLSERASSVLNSKNPISGVVSFPENPEISSLSAILKLRDDEWFLERHCNHLTDKQKDLVREATKDLARIEPLVETDRDPFVVGRTFEMWVGKTLVLRGKGFLPSEEGLKLLEKKEIVSN